MNNTPHPLKNLRIVLFEPEIPQNTGSIIRSSSCFGFSVHLIEPFGFIFSDKKMKRSAMDYVDDAEVFTYTSFNDFLNKKDEGRLVLLTPQTPVLHDEFDYLETDYLLMGKESSGVPSHIEALCDTHLRIPMLAGKRSLNLAVSAGIVMSVAARHLKRV